MNTISDNKPTGLNFAQLAIQEEQNQVSDVLLNSGTILPVRMLNEIFFQIAESVKKFDYIDVFNASKVCRHWRHLIQDKHLDYFAYTKIFTEYSYKTFIANLRKKINPVPFHQNFPHHTIAKLIFSYEDCIPIRTKGSAILRACLNKDVDVVRFLINYTDSDPSYSENDAMCIAVNNGCAENIKILLDDSRVNLSNEIFLHAFKTACKEKQLELIHLYLNDQTIDVSAEDNQAIQIACKHNCIEAVRLLLKDPRVDPTVDNYYTLRIACINENIELIKLLLDDSRINLNEIESNEILWMIQSNLENWTDYYLENQPSSAKYY